MKKHFLLLAMLCLAACKTRQVSTAKTSVVDQSVIKQMVKTDSQSIDTTKTTTHTLSTQQVRDSVEIIVTPDTGVVQIINGNYLGRARNIVIKKQASASSTLDELLQQNKGQITQSTISDSMVRQNNISTQTKTKQVIAKGIGLWWIWVVILVAAAAIGIGLVKKWI